MVIVGWGALARNYQKAAQEAGQVSNESKDWLGIFATHLNALLVQAVLSKKANPDTNKKAKPIAKMTWQQYFALVPPAWTPGAHYPVYISAAKLANKENIDFIVADGNNLANFKKIIKNQKFHGTIISNTG